MNLATIADGLAALIDRLTGLTNTGADGGDTVFPDDEHQAIASFRLTSAVGVGRDELRRDYDPDAVIEGDTSGPGGTPATGGVVVTSGGPRVLTYTITIECGRQDITAAYFLEKLRTGLGLPSARRELNAIGCGYSEFRTLRDTTASFANREISYAVGELILNAADTAGDAPVTTVKHVVGTAGDLPFEKDLGSP